MRASAAFLLRRWSAVVLVASLLPLTQSCKEDDPQPTVNTVHLAFQHNGPGNTTPFRLNTTYATPTGQPYKLDLLIYYVSNIKLIRADNSAWAEPLSYHLIRVAGAPASNPMIKLISVPQGTFTAIEFGLGVDSVANHYGDQLGDLSPNIAPFWNWTTGYKFWSMEGDYLPVGDTVRSLIYHIGRDPQYRTVRLPLPAATPASVTGASSPEIHLDVDINQFFRNLDLTDPAQRVEMGGTSISARIADNMATLFRVEYVHNETQ